MHNPTPDMSRMDKTKKKYGFKGNVNLTNFTK